MGISNRGQPPSRSADIGGNPALNRQRTRVDGRCGTEELRRWLRASISGPKMRERPSRSCSMGNGELNANRKRRVDRFAGVGQSSVLLIDAEHDDVRGVLVGGE